MLQLSKTNNRLLDALPDAVRQRVIAASHTAVHSEGDVLYRHGVRPRYVYFPISGMASVMYTSADGSTVELEHTGCEGLVGWLSLLGRQVPVGDCVVRVAGRSLSLHLKHLQREFDETSAVRDRVLEYAQNQVVQARQLSACNRLHPAPARIARWVQLVSECIASDTVPVTQATLAGIVGTRRTTVTEVVGALAAAKTVEVRRGTIRVLDPDALRKATCECYGILHARLRALYGKP